MAGGLWAAERRALTGGLVLTITFVAAEALAVVTVMPVVARDLHGLGLYGWAFTAFQLGTIIGIVAAGRQADQRGPALPYIGGVLLFVAGLAVAGAAPTMPVLVAGRALQGIGGGAVPAVAYAVIGRSLPDELRPRMLAVLSTAWVAPGLAGPALAAEVARLFGWRWVFLGLIPVVAVTSSLAVPALIRLGRPGRAASSGAAPGGRAPAGGTSADPAPPGQRLTDGVLVAVGGAVLLGGLTLLVSRPLIGGPLIVAGLAAVVPPLRRLLPAGALTARAGLPATVLTRGLLTFAFFGADAFVTLAITTARQQSTTIASIAVTGATVSWTIGAWIQARLSRRWPGPRLVRVGLAVIVTGQAGMALMLQPSVPVAEGIAAWTVAGLGMGLAYAPTTLMALGQAPPGREGYVSASISLCDVLGTALGIGAGGAAIAATRSAGLPLPTGILVAFALAAAAAAAILLVSPRLPRRPLAAPDPERPRTQSRS